MKTPFEAFLSQHPSFSDPTSASSPLPSLYSDLSRQKNSNPAGYRSNVDWWHRILVSVVWKGVQGNVSNANSDGSGGGGQDRLILHLDEAAKARWTVEQVGRPLGLGTVVSELEREGKVVGLSRFLKSFSPIHGPSSNVSKSRFTSPTSLAINALSWTFSQLGLLSSSSSSHDDEYSEDERLWSKFKGDWVIWSNLERAANAFLQKQYPSSCPLSPLETLFSPSEFRQTLIDSQDDDTTTQLPPLTENDLNVLFKYLSRDRNVVIVENDVVKLSSSEHQPPSPITLEDRGILSVKQTKERLEHQITDIEIRIKNRNEKVKTSLNVNQKSQALSYLRSRKHLEELLIKRMTSLETISSVLIKIEQAVGDIEIMNVYSTSTMTLKSLLSHPCLEIEKVQQTIQQLADTVADQREIDQAIQTGSIQEGEEELDQQELENQFKLLEEQVKTEDKIKQLDSLEVFKEEKVQDEGKVQDKVRVQDKVKLQEIHPSSSSSSVSQQQQPSLSISQKEEKQAIPEIV